MTRGLAPPPPAAEFATILADPVRSLRHKTGARAALATVIAAAASLALTQESPAATLSGTVETSGHGVARASVELRQAGPTGSRELARARSEKGGGFELDYAPDPSGGPLYAVADGGRGTTGRRTRLMTVLGDPAGACLLYTSPSPRDGLLSRMPSSA